MPGSVKRSGRPCGIPELGIVTRAPHSGRASLWNGPASRSSNAASQALTTSVQVSHRREVDPNIPSRSLRRSTIARRVRHGSTHQVLWVFIHRMDPDGAARD